MDIFDVAIVGSGPAGLTAGLYTGRANLKTLLFAGSKWGGQLMLTTLVENYPGFPDGVQGPELMQKMRAQTEKFGAKFVEEQVTTVTKSGQNFELSTPNSPYFARSVIIATGADTIWLGLPSEQRLIGHGVSSCAPCDAFFFKSKKVAVVGGGDSAMEEALVLTKFASQVTIIHRRDTFRASKIMVDRVLSDPKITPLYNTEVVEIFGETKVEGLKVKTSIGDSKFEIKDLVFDGVFVAIGHSPNSNIFKDIVDLDEKGFVKRIPTDPYQTTTSQEGIFVAGDVHDHHYKQAVTAAAFGCQAALETEKWLADNPSL